MGRKLDALLGRTSRQMAQLKPLLGLAVSRLAVLRGRRQARCDLARGDVAQLLQLGHVDRALFRVEHVIKEQNMLDVFAMVEHYCHLLAERTVLLDHKECPEELREATASLIFAASRCAELPELDKLRGIFASKYGKEFVSAAVELRNDCRVNAKMIQKLSTRQPSLEMRQRVTKEIATEKGIKLEFYDPSSETAEGDTVVNPSMNLSDENLPMRGHGNQKYKDVADAAQAAFESAALAAAAARAAVELCRSDSQGKGSDDDENKAGGQKRSEIKESKRVNVETSAVSKNFEGIHHDHSYSSDSEDEIKAKQNDLLQKERPGEKFNSKQIERPTLSSSDSSDEEDNMNSNEQSSAGPRGKNIFFDKSDNETRRYRLYARNEELSPGFKNGHGIQVERRFDESSEDGSADERRVSYLHPPYYGGNEIRYGEKNNNSLHEETNKVVLRSGTEGNHAMYNKGESTYLDSVDDRRRPHWSSGKKPISVRTRREL